MRRHPPADLSRFVEALLALSAASLAIRLLPFRGLVATMGRAPLLPSSVSLPSGDIRCAIDRAARRLPWPTVCIQQGLAAHWMLRRRGIDSRLHYGLRPTADRLSAHVWVEANGTVVIGEEESGAAHLRVAAFPPPAVPPPG